MAINKIQAQEAVKNLLSAFDIDVSRHSDIEKTPERVVKMLAEMWQGEQYTNEEIATMFGKTFDSDSADMVVVDNIPCFSYCEHHLALMYNMNVSIAYIPRGKVIGLSKIIRIVDMVSKRLQLQEKLTKDIAEVLLMACDTDSVTVYVSGEHSCMTTRGIKRYGEKTITTYYTGEFKDNKNLRDEFLCILKSGD